MKNYNENGELMYITIYIYIGWNTIYEKTIYPDLTETETKYIYGASGHMAKITDTGTIETTTFYHTDHLGSVRQKTDSDGNSLWASYAIYKPFGGLYSGGPSDESETHLYTGKTYDYGTGLYYYGARFYDPEVGRFISEDAVPSVNRYVYVRNNPLKYIDPSGNQTAVTCNGHCTITGTTYRKVGGRIVSITIYYDSGSPRVIEGEALDAFLDFWAEHGEQIGSLVNSIMESTNLWQLLRRVAALKSFLEGIKIPEPFTGFMLQVEFAAGAGGVVEYGGAWVYVSEIGWVGYDYYGVGGGPFIGVGVSFQFGLFAYEDPNGIPYDPSKFTGKGWALYGVAEIGFGFGLGIFENFENTISGFIIAPLSVGFTHLFGGYFTIVTYTLSPQMYPTVHPPKWPPG